MCCNSLPAFIMKRYKVDRRLCEASLNEQVNDICVQLRRRKRTSITKPYPLTRSVRARLVNEDLEDDDSDSQER